MQCSNSGYTHGDDEKSMTEDLFEWSKAPRYDGFGDDERTCEPVAEREERSRTYENGWDDGSRSGYQNCLVKLELFIMEKQRVFKTIHANDGFRDEFERAKLRFEIDSLTEILRRLREER